MKLLRSIFVTLLLALSVAAHAIEPSGEVVTLNGKRYYVHSVEQGQTLYSIARTYNVTVDDILAANEGLTISTLRYDQTIYVPVVELSKREQKRLKREAKSASNEALHTVQPGETVYSLSRRFGLSEEQFMAINNLSSSADLKAGMSVRTKVEEAETDAAVAEQRPNAQHPQSEAATPLHPADTARYDAALYDAIRRQEAQALVDTTMVDRETYAYLFGDEESLRDSVQPLDIEFLRLGDNNVLKAALVMPFHANSKVNPNAVDFYRGMLLAMEELKKGGMSIELSVFDTENSVPRIKELLAYEDGLLDANIIFGPVYEDEVRHILPLAEDNHIPLITPFADMSDMSSPVLFQMQPAAEFRSDKLTQIFPEAEEVVYIYAATNDNSFVSDMRVLTDSLPSRSLNFVYNRQPLLYRRNSDGTNGELISDKSLLRSQSKKLFVIAADKDTDVDRILATLSSARIYNVERGLSVGDYVVAGNRRWMRMASLDHQLFFKNNVAFIVAHHAKRHEYVIRQFDAAYIRAYRMLPTIFAYRGYEAAMIFCRKMFTGLDASIFEETFCPLTTTYRFKFENGMYSNSEWILEQYNRNFTIVVK